MKMLRLGTAAAILGRSLRRRGTSLVRAGAAAARDRSGNVAILSALCALPMIGIVGMGIDYGTALSVKSKLDAAADAAVISAITKVKTEINAGVSQSKAITDGQAQGVATFRANAGLVAFGKTPPTPIVTITATGAQTLNATVTYTTQTPNQFGKIFNVAYSTVAGKASSNSIVTPYYQFIFVVDISGSMAIGGTAADIAKLNADPKIGCAVACHDPLHNRGPDYRAYAKADGEVLKIDYVNQAIQQFISDLQTQITATGVKGYFSVGIDAYATNFYTIQAPTPISTTAQAAAVQAAASTIDIEPMMPLSTSQGYTLTTQYLNQALTNVTNMGDGSAVNAQKTFFIFLSDGVEDTPGPLIYGRGTDVTYTSACTNIKNAGGTIISIYPVYPVVSDPQYPILVAPIANQLAPAMQACASSPSQAYVATDGPGINTAVQQALQSILQGLTRLTY